MFIAFGKIYTQRPAAPQADSSNLMLMSRR